MIDVAFDVAAFCIMSYGFGKELATYLYENTDFASLFPSNKTILAQKEIDMEDFEEIPAFEDIPDR